MELIWQNLAIKSLWSCCMQNTSKLRCEMATAVWSDIDQMISLILTQWHAFHCHQRNGSGGSFAFSVPCSRCWFGFGKRREPACIPRRAWWVVFQFRQISSLLVTWWQGKNSHLRRFRPTAQSVRQRNRHRDIKIMRCSSPGEVSSASKEFHFCSFFVRKRSRASLHKGTSLCLLSELDRCQSGDFGTFGAVRAWCFVSQAVVLDPLACLRWPDVDVRLCVRFEPCENQRSSFGSSLLKQEKTFQFRTPLDTRSSSLKARRRGGLCCRRAAQSRAAQSVNEEISTGAPPFSSSKHLTW